MRVDPRPLARCTGCRRLVRIPLGSRVDDESILCTNCYAESMGISPAEAQEVFRETADVE